MNMAEALARELVRVTEVREHYREAGKQPNVNVAFALASIDHALDFGCTAAGGGDVLQIIQAYEALKEIHD